MSEVLIKQSLTWLSDVKQARSSLCRRERNAYWIEHTGKGGVDGVIAPR
jgi:hypothetical protein